MGSCYIAECRCSSSKKYMQHLFFGGIVLGLGIHASRLGLNTLTNYEFASRFLNIRLYKLVAYKKENRTGSCSQPWRWNVPEVDSGCSRRALLSSDQRSFSVGVL